MVMQGTSIGCKQNFVFVFVFGNRESPVFESCYFCREGGESNRM